MHTSHYLIKLARFYRRMIVTLYPRFKSKLSLIQMVNSLVRLYDNPQRKGIRLRIYW